MIGIIDYGAGNISSIGNIIKKMGGDYFICKKPEYLNRADKIIIPGVGSFDYGMDCLVNGGWIHTLNELVINQNKDILGICLGMQLMCNKSEEGIQKGLGWINANVKKFDFSDHRNELKIPHMGWNNIEIIKENKILINKNDEKRFYFVHSYYVECIDSDNIIAITKHGRNFTAAFHKGNIYGVQFHPEKSHKFGMELIKNFISY